MQPTPHQCHRAPAPQADGSAAVVPVLRLQALPVVVQALTGSPKMQLISHHRLRLATSCWQLLPPMLANKEHAPSWGHLASTTLDCLHLLLKRGPAALQEASLLMALQSDFSTQQLCLCLALSHDPLLLLVTTAMDLKLLQVMR